MDEFDVDFDLLLKESDSDDRRQLYDRIFVPHAKARDAATRIASLLRQTDGAIRVGDQAEAADDLHAAKKEELWILPIIGPSGSTKSRTIKWVTENIHRRRRTESARPVMVVTLRATTRDTRDLQVAILEAFSDPSARKVKTMHDYNEWVVNRGIIRIARKKQTTLIFLDEAHNMLRTVGIDEMAAALKSLVNDSAFSLVVAGTEELRPLFSHKELFERSLLPILFRPPGLHDLDGCREFFEFVEKLCRQMFTDGVISAPFEPFASVNQAATLFDMSEGNLGRVVRIIRRGLVLSAIRGLTTLDWPTVIDAHNEMLALRSDSDCRPAVASARTLAMVRSFAGR